MVRVTNFLGVSTDALVSIQKVEASLPTVVIEGGITRSVDSSSVLRIKPSCSLQFVGQHLVSLLNGDSFLYLLPDLCLFLIQK